MRRFPKRVTYDSLSHSRVIIPVLTGKRMGKMLSVSDGLLGFFGRASHHCLRRMATVMTGALCCWPGRGSGPECGLYRYRHPKEDRQGGSYV